MARINTLTLQPRYEKFFVLFQPEMEGVNIWQQTSAHPLHLIRCGDAIDKLWDEGAINNEIYEGWLHEHMRTP